MRQATDTIYDNLRFTHRVYEKQCELLSLGAFITRLVSVVLICAVLFLQFLQFIDTNHSSSITVWAIILTVLEVGVAFFQLNFNYDKLLDQHRATAKNLLTVKNRLIVAMTEKLTKPQLELYVDELNDLYTSAPQTNRLAKWLTNREDKK